MNVFTTVCLSTGVGGEWGCGECWVSVCLWQVREVLVVSEGVW